MCVKLGGSWFHQLWVESIQDVKTSVVIYTAFLLQCLIKTFNSLSQVFSLYYQCQTDLESVILRMSFFSFSFLSTCSYHFSSLFSERWINVFDAQLDICTFVIEWYEYKNSPPSCNKDDSDRYKHIIATYPTQAWNLRQQTVIIYYNACTSILHKNLYIHIHQLNHNWYC